MLRVSEVGGFDLGEEIVLIGLRSTIGKYFNFIKSGESVHSHVITDGFYGNSTFAEWGAAYENDKEEFGMRSS